MALIAHKEWGMGKRTGRFVRGAVATEGAAEIAHGNEISAKMRWVDIELNELMHAIECKLASFERIHRLLGAMEPRQSFGAKGGIGIRLI